MGVSQVTFLPCVHTQKSDLKNQAFRKPNQPKDAKRDAKGCQKAPKGRPKGAKGSQKRGQREPRGSPKRLKIDEKSKFFLESVLDAKKGRQSLICWPLFANF